jgi:hypothetical protein
MPGVPQGQYEDIVAPRYVEIMPLAPPPPRRHCGPLPQQLLSSLYRLVFGSWVIGTRCPFGTKQPPFGSQCTALGLGITKCGKTVPFETIIDHPQSAQPHTLISSERNVQSPTIAPASPGSQIEATIAGSKR